MSASVTPAAGVTEETLSLQLLGGKLTLENLRIRETAFAEIELPVCASGSGVLRVCVFNTDCQDRVGQVLSGNLSCQLIYCAFGGMSRL
jgi:hypothetical protein